MLKIRIASEKDAEELLAIYAEYVTNTAVTFEYEVPTAEEFRTRIRNTLKKYPYLAAEQDGVIVGYAYAGPFHPRAAYAWAAETSIYIDMGKRRGGIGKKLYETLEMLLKEQGILSINACVAYPRTEDRYLTKDSVLFHEKMGYRMVGTFHACGYKFNRWYDMVWLEKSIGVHREHQEPVKWFPDIENLLTQ